MFVISSVKTRGFGAADWKALDAQLAGWIEKIDLLKSTYKKKATN